MCEMLSFPRFFSDIHFRGMNPEGLVVLLVASSATQKPPQQRTFAVCSMRKSKASNIQVPCAAALFVQPMWIENEGKRQQIVHKPYMHT